MTYARAAAFIGIGWLSLLVCGALRSLIALPIPVPDLALIIVLYLGLGARGPAPLHAGCAIALGYLADLLGGAPRGLHALSLALVMLLARSGASRLLVTRVWQELVVTFAVALGHGALVIALASPLYDGGATSALRQVPTAALSTALFAPFLFALLRRIDRKLAPDPRTIRMPGL